MRSAGGRSPQNRSARDHASGDQLEKVTARIPRKGQKVVMRIPWPAYGAKGCYEDCWRAVAANRSGRARAFRSKRGKVTIRMPCKGQTVVMRIIVVITSKQV